MTFDVDETLVNSWGYASSLLYKYRLCDDNGFDMLEKGYIWASIPDGFIDPIDSKVNLRLRRMAAIDITNSLEIPSNRWESNPKLEGVVTTSIPEEMLTWRITEPVRLSESTIAMLS